MLKLLALLALTYLTATADTAVAPLLAIERVAPSLLVLLGMVWVVSTAPTRWRIAEAAGVGLAFDFNSGGRAGIGLIAVALAADVLVHVRATLRRVGPFGQALATAPLAAAVLVFVALGNALCGESIAPLPLVLWRALAAGVYTAAIGVPLWMILDWLRDLERRAPQTASF